MKQTRGEKVEVKKLRKNQNVSQIELAYGADIGRFRLFLIEKGFESPNADEALRISTYLSKKKTCSPPHSERGGCKK